MDRYLEDVWAMLAMFLVASLVNAYLKHRRLVALMPSSLRPLPFLGSILSIPHRDPWKTYAAWSKMCHSTPHIFIQMSNRLKSINDGDLVSVRAFGRLTIVVNTAKAARELFEQRICRLLGQTPHSHDGAVRCNFL